MKLNSHHKPLTKNELKMDQRANTVKFIEEKIEVNLFINFMDKAVISQWFQKYKEWKEKNS